MGIITVPDLSIKVDLVDLKIYQIFCLSKMGSLDNSKTLLPMSETLWPFPEDKYPFSHSSVACLKAYFNSFTKNSRMLVHFSSL